MIKSILCSNESPGVDSNKFRSILSSFQTLEKSRAAEGGGGGGGGERKLLARRSFIAKQNDDVSQESS